MGMQASVEHLEKHYADLSKKPFFAGLVTYIASGPGVAMVWEGLGAVKTGRVMLGETNPADSKPGTIRGDCAVQGYQQGDCSLVQARRTCGVELGTEGLGVRVGKFYLLDDLN